MTGPQMAIVGGGISGLVAAYERTRSASLAPALTA
jgi:monoamine oxidase